MWWHLLQWNSYSLFLFGNVPKENQRSRVGKSLFLNAKCMASPYDLLSSLFVDGKWSVAVRTGTENLKYIFQDITRHIKRPLAFSKTGIFWLWFIIFGVFLIHCFTNKWQLQQELLTKYFKMFSNINLYFIITIYKFLTYLSQLFNSFPR